LGSWRLPYYDHSLFRRTFFKQPPFSAKTNKIAEAHTYLRRSRIPGHALDKRVAVHNGYTFHSFVVKPWMLNHRFGEFVVTKKLGTLIHRFRSKREKRQKREAKEQLAYERKEIEKAKAKVKIDQRAEKSLETKEKHFDYLDLAKSRKEFMLTELSLDNQEREKLLHDLNLLKQEREKISNNIKKVSAFLTTLRQTPEEREKAEKEAKEKEQQQQTV